MYAPPPPTLPPETGKKRRTRSWTLAFLGWAFAGGMILMVAGGLAGGYFLWDISKGLPDYEKLAQYEPPVMTRIHANDGRLLAEFAHERRVYVPINTVPKMLINAFISAEDKNFYTPHGLDLKALGAAVIANVRRKLGMGGSKRGASTITQQVAKNFLLTSEQTLIRKAKEAILAVRIERTFSKDQIMELYLNEIFFGLRAYGVAAAALNYFGKSLKELELHEMAYLATLPKGPNNYHPFRKPQRAIKRRNWILGRMRANGYITEKQMEEARKMPLGVNPRPFGARIFAAEYFAEEVRRKLLAQYGEKKLYGGGLSVRTTLNPKMQRWAKKALVDGLVAYDRRHGWRGPLAHIDNFTPGGEDWGKLLVKKAPRPYSDIAPWRQALVLEVSGKQAKIGLRPPRLKSGRFEEKRETGIIPLSEVKWARKLIKVRITKKGKRIESKGKRPKKVADVLSAGDIIYVSPMRPRPKKGKRKALSEADVAGKWRLMQIPKVGGAIVAMDPHTGRVLAMVGGFSYDASNFNRATQAMRQPGSSFKPFVYATALDNGYSPATVILDAPLAIEQGNGQDVWRPQNYGKKFYGPSTLRTGIERSRNLMTVRLAQDMGMPVIAEYARRFGVYDNLMPVLSMSLGAGETTLIRLATGYCMIANGGHQVKASLIDRIQDRYGKTIYRHDERKCIGCDADKWENQPEPELIDNRKQIIDPHTAYQITSMMEGVVKRGTGVRVGRALKGIPLAGKTGTTNDERDAWFMGFSPDLVVGVFVGFDNPTPMGKGETGGHVAAPIFTEFMKMAMKGKKAIPFRIPPGIRLVRINRKTGSRAQPGDPDAILEAFKPDTVIPENSGIGEWDYGGGNGQEYVSPAGRGLY
jgi:penicillin-binding protein 1A